MSRAILPQPFDGRDHRSFLWQESDRAALLVHGFPGTPAESAGLRVNDVVLQVENLAIRDENQLINLISSLPAGQRIRMQVWRDRRVATYDAIIGDWQEAQSRFRAER